MFKVSVGQFRIVCLIALGALLLAQLPAWGLLSFSKGVTTLRLYKYYGALAPVWVIWLYATSALALLVIGLVGMLNFWRFSRWSLAAALTAALTLRPLMGMVVVSAYEAFFAGVCGTLALWLMTVSFWTPLAQQFTQGSQGGGMLQ